MSLSFLRARVYVHASQQIPLAININLDKFIVDLEAVVRLVDQLILKTLYQIYIFSSSFARQAIKPYSNGEKA